MQIILLKWGTKYCADDVNKQAASLRKYCDYPIFCFTEDPTAVEIPCLLLPKKPKLTRWWNKLLLFRDDFMLEGRCVLFDLDIQIIDNPFKHIEYIDWTTPHFLYDYWKEDLVWNKHAYETMLNSSILAWTPLENQEYWNTFNENIDYNTRKYRGIDRYVWDKKLKYSTFDDEIHSTIKL